MSTEPLALGGTGMAYDVLMLIRSELDSLSNADGYETLARIAGPLSCLTYGHPDQPTRRLRRFRAQPWRCVRCETWWVTVRSDHPDGHWQWMRVDDELKGGVS